MYANFPGDVNAIPLAPMVANTHQGKRRPLAPASASRLTRINASRRPGERRPPVPGHAHPLAMVNADSAGLNLA